MSESSIVWRDSAFYSISFLGLITPSTREAYLMTLNHSTLGRSKKISRKHLSVDKVITLQVHHYRKSVVLTHRKDNRVMILLDFNAYFGLHRGFIFETFAREGAILITPDGATTQDLL